MLSSRSPQQTTDDVLIIGAGPAGLTAGYHLTQNSSLKVRILESNPRYVGGISRTETYNGYSFDIGGHRFFTKSDEIEKLWKEILPDALMKRSRLSRIYYKNKFYSYPLRALQAFLNLGLIESTRCMASYVWVRLFPIANPQTFTQWVSNKFGRRLFLIFFKTYTEKVWGITTDQLSADWAAQRIKGLSLSAAILSSFKKSVNSNGKAKIKTLTETFLYPKRGPGMMWEAAAQKIKDKGGILEMDRKAVQFHWSEKARLWSVTALDAKGQPHSYLAKRLISSAPLRELAQSLTPALTIKDKAKALRYRDFLTVVLMLDAKVPFNDNWIYIHDPNVRVGRVQNFAAWSPDMVPSKREGCLGLEYFCFEGDELWSASDADLVALARKEIAKLGLIDTRSIHEGRVVRQAKAYPIYDEYYEEAVTALRQEMQASFPTLHLIGRNGMHKYDNQDHAMMTGLLTARNILAGKTCYDPWLVNEDAEYHEERDCA